LQYFPQLVAAMPQHPQKRKFNTMSSTDNITVPSTADEARKWASRVLKEECLTIRRVVQSDPDFSLLIKAERSTTLLWKR
jgi:hypothetical protein